MTKYLYSPIKQRILLLLASGIVLGLSTSPRTHAKVWKSLPKAWKEIGRSTLRRVIREFKYKRLVDFKEEKDGIVVITISELGKKYAIRYDPENIKIKKPLIWDKKWRIVIFDVPEKKKPAREALRRELRKLGFKELQKSVWCFPYDCKNAIDFICELFDIRHCVRILEVSRMSHDADLKLRFGLT